MKKLLSVIISLLLAFTLAACADKPEKITGIFDMVSVTVDGADAHSDFTLYTVEFGDEVTVKTGYFGFVETRTCSYSISGNTIKESRENGGTYTLDGDTLSYQGNEPDIGFVRAEFVRRSEKETSGEVDFDSILFGPDIAIEKFYNYCPAVMLSDDGNTMHIYYCTNKVSGEIYDCIGYRTGERQENGKWRFSEQSIALEPTAGTWDERHVCDPAVVKGEFSYDGESYNYMMLYLGCRTEDNSNNENGMAVAKDPAGPWTKVYFGDNNDLPLSPFNKNPEFKDTWEWGKGQGAIVSVDKKGEVLVFTTVGGAKSLGFSGTWLERWDFSDLNSPKKLEERALPTRGVKNGNGNPCGVTNGDYVYDPASGRIYFSAERGPIVPEGEPSFVHSHSHVMYMEKGENSEKPGANLFAAKTDWQLHGTVGFDVTGYHRNHNTGIVRTEYGWLPAKDEIKVIVTTAILDQPNEGVFTYRLRGVTMPIN